MNKVTWIVFSASVVLILGGLVIYSQASRPSADVSNVNPTSISEASDANGNIADHVLGKADSQVILVEYGDFQCPSCGAAHPKLQAIIDEYGDRIAFVFRNLPLSEIHPNARAAAASAEAAGLQGKYWEMHDQLYENQSSWENATPSERTTTFAGYAREIGLDVDKFSADLTSGAITQKLAFDAAVFGKTGFAKSTPTIVLNGEKVSEQVGSDVVQGNGDELRKLIDDKL